MKTTAEIDNTSLGNFKGEIKNGRLTKRDYNLYLYPLIKKTAPDVLKKLILCYYAFRIRTRIKPFRFIFLLAHMRSGSTLLTHLLNSNRDIIGAAESGIFYHSKKDLLVNIYNVYLSNQSLRFRAKHVVDQINHNRFLPNEELLHEDNMLFIFLIRDPLKTLNSLLANPHYSTTRTEKDALFYYVSRLQKLEYYARKIDNKTCALFFTHDKLINQTNEVFMKLRAFLGLSKPLSENYRILPITGKRSDHSVNIRKGHIMRNYETPQYHVSDLTLRIAQYFFDRCSETLSEYCSTVS